MKPDYAFEFKGLAVLLPLELTEPADEADIEAITTILDRRPGAHTSRPAEQADRPRQHSTWFRMGSGLIKVPVGPP